MPVISNVSRQKISPRTLAHASERTHCLHRAEQDPRLLAVTQPSYWLIQSGRISCPWVHTGKLGRAEARLARDREDRQCNQLCAKRNGQKYQVSGKLVGPNGKAANFKTIWLVESEASAPIFLTAYPE